MNYFDIFFPFPLRKDGCSDGIYEWKLGQDFECKFRWFMWLYRMSHTQRKRKLESIITQVLCVEANGKEDFAFFQMTEQCLCDSLTKRLQIYVNFEINYISLH